MLVLGCSGSGKTTFARALSTRTGLPFVSLDALFWRPGWVEGDAAMFGARMRAEAAADRWIMDGNFLEDGAGPERIARADTIVWFDLPTVRCIVSVLWRTGTGHGGLRPEMAAGCPERFDLGFLRYVLGFRRAQRPKLAMALTSLRLDQRLVHAQTRRAAYNAFPQLRA